MEVEVAHKGSQRQWDGQGGHFLRERTSASSSSPADEGQWADSVSVEKLYMQGQITSVLLQSPGAFLPNTFNTHINL
jgi:hypothetical protein